MGQSVPSEGWILVVWATKYKQPIHPTSTHRCITETSGTQGGNTLSVIVTIWHHIIVSLKVMAQKGFIGTLISWGKCINEKLTGEKSVF